MTTTAAPRERTLEPSVGRVLAQLQRQYARAGEQPTSWASATMAALRNATPGRPQDDPATWEVTFAAVPPGLVGKDDEPSAAERAAHAALVLYAVHQASQPLPMHVPGVSLGQALRRLPDAENIDGPILRRFNSLVSAATFDAAMYHLRSLMTLLRRERIPCDHARLAGDLLGLLNPRRAPNVRMRWGRDYFRFGGPADASQSTDSAEIAAQLAPPSDAQD